MICSALTLTRRKNFGQIGEGGACTPPTPPLAGGFLDLFLFESALRDENLPQVPKHLLLYLIFRSNETDTCYGSQEKIAKQLVYHRQRINEATTWLRRAKYIKTRTKGRILTYDLSATRTRYSSTCPPSGQQMSAPRTSTCPPSGHRTRSELAIRTVAPAARYYDPGKYDPNHKSPTYDAEIADILRRHPDLARG